MWGHTRGENGRETTCPGSGCRNSDPRYGSGCRDPLVVWEEENVLVDGHHRIAICRKHGLSYSVVYRSFPDIEAVKRWMRLNQLSRRNLDKDERERWIKELHEEGWTQAEIGEAVGANQSTVSRVLMQTHKSQISQTDDSTTTQRLKDELARLRAEKDALAEKQRHEVEARAALDP